MTAIVDLLSATTPFITLAMLSLVAATYVKNDKKLSRKFVYAFLLFLFSAASILPTITYSGIPSVFITFLLITAGFVISGFSFLISGALSMIENLK